MKIVVACSKRRNQIKSKSRSKNKKRTITGMENRDSKYLYLFFAFVNNLDRGDAISLQFT